MADMTVPHRFYIDKDSYPTGSFHSVSEIIATAIRSAYNEILGVDAPLVRLGQYYGTYGVQLLNYDGNSLSNDLYLAVTAGTSTDTYYLSIAYFSSGTLKHYVGLTDGNLKEPSVTFRTMFQSNASWKWSNKYPFCICFYPVKNGYSIGSFYDSRSDSTLVENAMHNGIPKGNFYVLRCTDNDDVVHTGVLRPGASEGIGILAPTIQDMSLLFDGGGYGFINTNSMTDAVCCKVLGEASFDAYTLKFPSSQLGTFKNAPIREIYHVTHENATSPTVDYFTYKGKTYETTVICKAENDVSGELIFEKV